MQKVVSLNPDDSDTLVELFDMGSDGDWSKGNFEDQTAKDYRLNWWRNLYIIGILGISIAILATSGGVAMGLAKSAPGLERTTNATLGMRHDTKELISGIKVWIFEKMLKGYPENQDKLWLARGDSMSVSIEHILRVVSSSFQDQAFDMNMIIAAGGKTLISEFVRPETKTLIETKIHQVAESIDPNAISMAINNFNKLCVTIEEAQKQGIVDHANKLIVDVDEAVKSFQNGRKITLEAKL